MIELSEEYKRRIIYKYNETGIKWLKSINEKIEKYKKKFNLYNIKLVKDLTMNILLFANSDEYGEIVMKIGAPKSSIINEIKYITLCSTKYIVKCYYYNIKDKVIIMERINPRLSTKRFKKSGR